MSDTRIGRTSVRTQHGLSRFGRRTPRDDQRHQRVLASAAVGVEVVGRSDVALPAALPTTALDLPVLRAEVPVETLPSSHRAPHLAPVDSLVEAPAQAPAAPVGAPAETPVEVATHVVAPARRRTPGLTLPGAAALGLGVAVAVGAPALPALGVALVWLAVALQQAPSRLMPGLSIRHGLAIAAASALAAAGLAVGLLAAPRVLVADSLALVATASLAAVALRRLRRIPRRRILVVGDGADLAAAAARWLGHPQVQVVGALLTGSDADLDDLVPSLGVPVAREAARLGELLDHTGAELVVVCGPVDDAALRQVAWTVEDRPVGLALAGPLDAVSPHRVAVTAYAGATLTHVRSSRPSRLGALAKTSLDRLAGLLLLTAVAPIMAALALWIRIDSPGPVFFRQTRVGHHGRHFTMWKLRTMVVDAERIKATLASQNEGSGLLFKMHADPRITAAGRVLRKLSLDELPQLINVVTGSMSLVGPRPALPAEVARYDAVARRRLAAKPGITGLWQVSGRSDLSWDESVRLDLHYTDNWRIRDDAMILARTAGAVINARGAY